MFPKLTASQILPADGYAGTLLGRALYPGVFPGPCVVVIREDGVHNISGTVPTMAELLNSPHPVMTAQKALNNCVHLGKLDDLLANSTPDTHNPLKPYLLTPIDLQAVKAAGVTFVEGLLQRVADAHKDSSLAALMEDAAGMPIANIQPNSPEAQSVRAALMERGLWTHVLESGFGPDAAIFTKAQPLSTVGVGAEVGIHPSAKETFGEPELVLLIGADGKARGATLGLDMSWRDMEARNPLLLNRSKDLNASCAVGPFIRLFDQSFTLPNVQGMKITYAFEGQDGEVFSDSGTMEQIGRPLGALVQQTISAHHGYPDGVALFTGCMFKPPMSRGAANDTFAHKVGDRITIKASPLGALINQVNHTDKVRPWNFGIADLMTNLANRQLLG